MYVNVIYSKPPSSPLMNHDEEEFVWVKMPDKIEPIDLKSKYVIFKKASFYTHLHTYIHTYIL